MNVRDIAHLAVLLPLVVVVMAILVLAARDGNDLFDWIVAAGAAGVLCMVLWSAVTR